MTLSKNGNRLAASVYKGLFTWRWFMYMVYSETFILANTFDTYRGFNLAPRCHSCTKTTLDFYCSIHLTSSWFIEPVWVLTDLANCHGYYILLFFLTYPVAISPWKNRSHTKRLPMGNMSSVTATTINELALTTNNYNLLSPTGPPSKVPSEIESNRNPWFKVFRYSFSKIIPIFFNRLKPEKP